MTNFCLTQHQKEHGYRETTSEIMGNPILLHLGPYIPNALALFFILVPMSALSCPLEQCNLQQFAPRDLDCTQPLACQHIVVSNLGTLVVAKDLSLSLSHSAQICVYLYSTLA